MEKELDFDDYPTLHLHMMIDDYEELCRRGREQIQAERVIQEELKREGPHYGIDPQGRFSFCFAD